MRALREAPVKRVAPGLLNPQGQGKLKFPDGRISPEPREKFDHSRRAAFGASAP